MTAAPIVPARLPAHAAAMLGRLRMDGPRVHCLMNSVVQGLVADGLSALGAIPSMTSSPGEVPHFARKADVLSVNLGTLDDQRRVAIGLALDVAEARAIPWVLDPAHCDYSPPRLALAQELLSRGPSAVRANEAEFAVLEVPMGVANIRTGRTDRIALAGQALVVGNGDPLMARVTGTGCLSAAVAAAFLAVDDDRLAACAAAMLVMGVAAEIASDTAQGPGSFKPALLDALHCLDAGDILQRSKVTDEQG